MRPYTSCLCLRAELVQENREMMTLLSYVGEDTQTHADAHTQSDVTLEIQELFAAKHRLLCFFSGFLLLFRSGSTAPLPLTVHHHTHAPSSLRRSCCGCFFLPLLSLETCTQAPARQALRKTKSCAVRRCQRQAPTHAAPSENPAIAAVANCAVVKGTAPQ